MTLDEAISYALEVVEQEECFINYPHSDIVLGDLDIESHKHYAAEQRQLAEWLTELKEAKRLLKEAVPIINNTFPEVGSCWGCANHDKVNDECKGGAFAECSEVCKWEHADEALALIGEDGDTNG